MSLRLRLAALSGLAVFAVVVLFGTGVYLALSVQLYDGVDTSLREYATVIQQRLHRAPSTRPVPVTRFLLGDPNEFAIAYDDYGIELGRSADAAGIPIVLGPQARAHALAGQTTVTTLNQHGQRYRLYVVPASSSMAVLSANDELATPAVIAVGQSLNGVDSALETLRVVLLAGGALGLLSALALGWVVAGRGLGPVSELTRAAERLGSDDLSRRLPESSRNDEISRLTTAFNASLDRLETVYKALEESLGRQRQFVADASHELRTPLTVIVNDAETLIEHPDAPRKEREECLTELVVEAKRMARLTKDLLQLARADSDGALEVAPVDWDALFADAVHDATRICGPRKVAVDLKAPLGEGSGDRASLLRAFRAFFENIARHTPKSASVTLRASADSGALHFSVRDTGPGVPSEVLPKIFDRFFRTEPSRRGPGAGLGLAIARAVIERHGGKVRAVSGEGQGFAVEVALPRQVFTAEEQAAEPASS